MGAVTMGTTPPDAPSFHDLINKATKVGASKLGRNGHAEGSNGFSHSSCGYNNNGRFKGFHQQGDDVIERPQIASGPLRPSNSQATVPHSAGPAKIPPRHEIQSGFNMPANSSHSNGFKDGNNSSTISPHKEMPAGKPPKPSGPRPPNAPRFSSPGEMATQAADR
eukprot:scaffold357504_cov36-Prasinocladus_malaysianus.AAC.1